MHEPEQPRPTTCELDVPESLPAEPALPAAPLSRRAMLVQVLIAIAVGVLPDLVNAVVFLATPAPPLDYPASAAGHVARMVQIVAVVLYLMSGSPDGFDAFGLRRYRPFKDTALALLTFLALMGSHFLFWYVAMALPGVEDLYARFPPAEQVFTRPQGPADHAAVVLMSVSAGVSEQLLVTAFLITRLRALTGSSTVAVLISAALFASYHIYQGPWAMPSIILFSLTAGAVFVVTRRIWPLMIAHALNDIATFLMV